MSFLNLEVLKRKPTKSIGIMPHLNISKTYNFGKKELKKQKKQKKKIASHIKIWSNFNYSKVPNY